MKTKTTAEHSPFTKFFKASSQVREKHLPDIITFKFLRKKTAKRFFDLLKENLPLLNTEYPKIDKRNVYITEEQFVFCLRQTMWESGNLTTEYIKDCLLKTLRADEFDYSYQFILGIIPGDNNSRRLHNLRPSQRQPFIIGPDGTITARINKQPMYSKEKKAGFSQAQSNTLLDPNALSRAFGFSRNQRNEKLYGIITHTDDSLFNRLLTDDSGTVTRIFDHESEEKAKKTLSDWLEQRLYHPDQIEEFLRANKKARLSNPRTNEVLARIRFNPNRTVVCICSDTLSARLLAYDFAQELLEHYKIYAAKQGITVNPNFKIPIIFYSEKKTWSLLFTGIQHNIRQYTDTMRHDDEDEAREIYLDINKRIEHYKYNDFEFLLGLPEITTEILLDQCLGQPLAYIMMRNGYTRMLMRLLKTPALREQVFDSLSNDFRGLFYRNDPIIGSLILAEQFDLADRLIQVTQSRKPDIKLERSEFKDVRSYLRHKGNPRQIDYIGLDDMLIDAAHNNQWVTVILCLKELPNIKNETLISLYSIASRNAKECESKLMFQKSFEIEAAISELFKTASSSRHWDQGELLIKNPLICQNKSLLGPALIWAIQDKKATIARLLINAGACPEKLEYRTHYIEGALVETIENRMFNLVPDVLKLEETATDDDAPIRLLVAFHLLDELENSTSLLCLEIIKNKLPEPSPMIIKIVICYLFIKALANDNPKLAEKRLIRLCQHYKFLAEDNHNIDDALSIIIEYLHEAATSISNFELRPIFSYIVNHYLKEKNGNKLISLLTSYDSTKLQSGLYYKQLHECVFHCLIKNLSNDTVDLIKSIKLEYIDSETDHKLQEYKLSNWFSILGRYFYEEALESKYCRENKLMLLFEVGFAPCGDACSSTLDQLLKKGYLNAAKLILTNPKISDKELTQCIEVISHYPQTIQSLAPAVVNKLTPKLIRQLSYQYFSVIKDILMEILKLENIEIESTIIVDFFLSVVEHSWTDKTLWELVESLILTPIIHQNKSLLGWVLIKALRSKQIPIARNLIKAGAQLIKNENYTHLIEGVLYHTLTNQLSELIPDAIAAEVRQIDSDSPIRYRVALQLALESSDPDSIRQLESIQDQLLNTPVRILKIAICSLFLSALGDKNPQLAEERLITMSHQYQLLPQDNNNIIDALDIIMENFHEAVTSIFLKEPDAVFSYLVKHYLAQKDSRKIVSLLTATEGANNAFYFCLHGQIYRNILSNISSDNIETINAFVHQYIAEDDNNQFEFNKVSVWEASLRQHFEVTMSSKDYTEEQILLLFDIGFILYADKWTHAFESLLRREYLRAAAIVLNHPKIPESDRDSCIDHLIYTHPQKTMQYFLPLLSNKIKPRHILRFSLNLNKKNRTQNDLLSMLKLVKIDNTVNQACFWDFYFVLDTSRFTETLEIEKELLRLLKPSTIKHLVLIYIVDRFMCYIKPFQESVLDKEKLNGRILQLYLPYHH